MTVTGERSDCELVARREPFDMWDHPSVADHNASAIEIIYR